MDLPVATTSGAVAVHRGAVIRTTGNHVRSRAIRGRHISVGDTHIAEHVDLQVRELEGVTVNNGVSRTSSSQRRVAHRRCDGPGSTSHGLDAIVSDRRGVRAGEILRQRVSESVRSRDRHGRRVCINRGRCSAHHGFQLGDTSRGPVDVDGACGIGPSPPGRGRVDRCGQGCTSNVSVGVSGRVERINCPRSSRSTCHRSRNRVQHGGERSVRCQGTSRRQLRRIVEMVNLSVDAWREVGLTDRNQRGLGTSRHKALRSLHRHTGRTGVGVVQQVGQHRRHFGAGDVLTRAVGRTASRSNAVAFGHTQVEEADD